MKKYVMFSLLTVAVSANAGYFSDFYSWLFPAVPAAAVVAPVAGTNEELAARRLRTAQTHLDELNLANSPVNLNNRVAAAMSDLDKVKTEGSSAQQAEATALGRAIAQKADAMMTSKSFAPMMSHAHTTSTTTSKAVVSKGACKGGSCKR